MIEKFGTELPSKSLDLQNSFNEIKETPETVHLNRIKRLTLLG